MIKSKPSIFHEYLKFKGLLKMKKDRDNVFDAMRHLMKYLKDNKIEVSFNMLDALKVFEYKTGGTVLSIAFSDKGNIGIAPWDECYYILDPNGNLLNKLCYERLRMKSMSYCCGRFAFASKDGYVRITDEDGNLLKMVPIDEDYDDDITLFDNGFIACGWNCARFDFDGEDVTMRWDVELWKLISDNPIIYKDYVYLPIDELLILKFSDGSQVGAIDCDKERREPCQSIAICNDKLAIVTNSHLYLYDLSDPTQPKELWNTREIIKGNQVTFSCDCKYIAVTDKGDKGIGINEGRLLVFDSKGSKVFENKYDDEAVAIAWWKDRLAVGFDSGKVCVYNVNRDNIDETLISLPFNLSLNETKNKIIVL